MSKKILVTGGSGFIGTHLVKALSPDYEVTVIDHKKGSQPGVKYIIGEYSEIAILTPETFDVVFHLAWSSAPASKLSLAEEVSQNVEPSQILIDWSKASGTEYFVFLSSAGAVYGEAPLPFKEVSPPQPTSRYGQAKLMIEHYLKLKASNEFKGVVFRATNVIGPLQRSNNNQGIIPTAITAIQEQKPIRLYGDAHKDYLTIYDLISALKLFQESDQIFEVFNVGSLEVLSTKEIVQLISHHLKKPLEIVPHAKNDYDPSRVAVDISKITNQLGWRPRSTVPDTIKDIINSLTQAN